MATDPLTPITLAEVEDAEREPFGISQNELVQKLAACLRRGDAFISREDRE